MSLVGKVLWRFRLELDSLWHKVIWSKFGLHLNGRGVTFVASWKLISQVYASFLPLTNSWYRDKVLLWEDTERGTIPFALAFPRLYSLSSLHHYPMYNFYSLDGTSLSRNFRFLQHVDGRELDELFVYDASRCQWRVVSRTKNIYGTRNMGNDKKRLGDPPTKAGNVICEREIPYEKRKRGGCVHRTLFRCSQKALLPLGPFQTLLSPKWSPNLSNLPI